MISEFDRSIAIDGLEALLFDARPGTPAANILRHALGVLRDDARVMGLIEQARHVHITVCDEPGP